MVNNRTIAYYDNAENDYFNQTINADMTFAYEKFQAHLPEIAEVLDAGCGSGRDSLHFIKSGYFITAMDASELMCERAEEILEQPVLHMSFDEMDFESCFDGVWACASLLHVGENELPDVFGRIIKSLKPGGFFYASWKYGDEERTEEQTGRFFCDMNEERIKNLAAKTNDAKIIEMWISSDVRKEMEDKKWMNVIVERKTV